MEFAEWDAESLGLIKALDIKIKNIFQANMFSTNIFVYANVNKHLSKQQDLNCAPSLTTTKAIVDALSATVLLTKHCQRHNGTKASCTLSL